MQLHPCYEGCLVNNKSSRALLGLTQPNVESHLAHMELKILPRITRLSLLVLNCRIKMPLQVLWGHMPPRMLLKPNPSSQLPRMLLELKHPRIPLGLNNLPMVHLEIKYPRIPFCYNNNLPKVLLEQL